MAKMTRESEVKLTNNTISESLYKIITRLQEGHSVDMSDIINTPEMRLAKQVSENIGVRDTSTCDPATRTDLRAGIRNKMMQVGSYSGKNSEGQSMYNGEVAYGKRLDLVIGLPASGKSSGLADVLSENFNGKLIDNDMVKTMIPEFANGWGADAVHSESKLIANKVMEDDMKLGKNLVIPKLGWPDHSLDLILDMAAENGYEVNVHLMDVEPNKALGRMLGRFVEDGRYIDPSWMENFTKDPDLMLRTLDKLKEDDRVTGYTVWTNNVDFGEKPILKDWSDNFEETDFIHNGRKDIENEKISAKESDIQNLEARLDVKNSVIQDQIRMDNTEKNRRAAEISTKLGFGNEIDRMKEDLKRIMDDWVKNSENTHQIAIKSELYNSLKDKIDKNNGDAKDTKSPEATKNLMPALPGNVIS